MEAMEQTREAMTQNLAERLCWQVARRDDARVARRLYRKQVVDGVYRLDEGAVLDDFCSVLQELGVDDWRSDVPGTAVRRAMVPCVQSVRLYSLKTRFGIESRPALPVWRCRDEALMRLVGCKAPPGRHGVCPRGAAPRQGPRTTGPICPEALAENMVQLNRRELETWFKGVIRALATQGVCGVQVTGMVDATDRETTAHDAGCGQGTRTRQRTAKRGNVQEIDVTVDGWTLMVCIAAGTTMPLAAPVVPIQQPDTRSLRALVTPARTHRAGHTRRHKVVFARGFWDGGDWWWLAQPGRRLVGPAKEHMAVPLDAQAHAAAGDGVTVGRRAHTVRRGQGNTTWTERLATEGVGLPGRTTDAQSGTPAHGRTHTRRDVQPHLSHAVVVRTWHNRDDGPGATRCS
jgi:hypothetical protein